MAQFVKFICKCPNPHIVLGLETTTPTPTHPNNVWDLIHLSARWLGWALWSMGLLLCKLVHRKKTTLLGPQNTNVLGIGDVAMKTILNECIVKLIPCLLSESSGVLLSGIFLLRSFITLVELVMNCWSFVAPLNQMHWICFWELLF